MEGLADGVESVIPNHRGDHRKATDCDERQKESLTQAEAYRLIFRFSAPHSCSPNEKDSRVIIEPCHWPYTALGVVRRPDVLSTGNLPVEKEEPVFVEYRFGSR